MKVKLLHEDALVPERAHQSDAGWDLYSIDTVLLGPRSRYAFNTGLAVEIPIGCYGRIAPRSGLSLKGIDVGAGVIDRGYTGEVKVLLINNSGCPIKIDKGSKIAQLILEKCNYEESIEVVYELDKTDRSDSGFGSTG
jgi:dUTP pyrophosphatase